MVKVKKNNKIKELKNTMHKKNAELVERVKNTKEKEKIVCPKCKTKLGIINEVNHAPVVQFAKGVKHKPARYIADVMIVSYTCPNCETITIKAVE